MPVSGNDHSQGKAGHEVARAFSFPAAECPGLQPSLASGVVTLLSLLGILALAVV
jgi:hypothetical protein